MRVTTLSFLLAVMGISCLIPGVGKTETNSVPTGQGSANDYQGPYDRWIKHGKLIELADKYNGISYGTYFYKNPSGEWIILRDNLGGINELFKNELANKEAIIGFMHAYGGGLARFLLDNMGQGGWDIVTKEEVDEYAQGDKNGSVKLRSYVIGTEPLVASNQWTLNLNVMTKRGGIEHWLVTGSMNPFQVSSFKRDVAVADGTFYGWLEY